MKTYEVVTIYRDGKTGTGRFTLGERVRYGDDRGAELVAGGYLREVPEAPESDAPDTEEATDG